LGIESADAVAAVVVVGLVASSHPTPRPIAPVTKRLMSDQRMTFIPSSFFLTQRTLMRKPLPFGVVRAFTTTTMVFTRRNSEEGRGPLILSA
jgi:hypothetical protein